MHILIIPSEHFITQSQPLGGIFQYHQAKALSKVGHKIGILSVGYITPRYLFSKYHYEKKENINNINILRFYKQLYFPHRFIPFSILKDGHIQMADDLYNKYINEFGKPDIIHAHNFLYAGVVANYLNQKYNIPYMITEHSSSLVKAKFTKNKIGTIRSIAKNAFQITAVSSAFVKVLKSIVDVDVEILPNVLDEFFIQQNFIKNEIEDFVFLNIAGLDKNKNHMLLIKAFASKFKDTKAILKIGGSGYMLNKLFLLVKDLEIEKQVEFLGRLTQKEVRQEMMCADCFVLSSNYETFGVVLIEALACGIPLIATKCGGPEDIANDTNGILVDVCNQKQLENAMLYMYENAKKYDKKQLREDAIKRFGENTFITNVLKYYGAGISHAKQ
ncbi:MAG: L-malate glycosyltransferase [Campylobacterota bacterium]|nr:L-malate glycosyltransferase [Campylobacterota bacterium]MDQ1338437.1 L-malate glycosyltransferase [Campylobacterota bacterium]